MTDLIARGMASMMVLGVVVTFLLGGFVPWFAWSLAHNTKKIRQQLERLNTTLEAQSGPTRVGRLGI